MRAALITVNTDDNTPYVENVMEISSEDAIDEVKAAFGYDYVILVDENVSVGCKYDPANGVVYNTAGVRVFPSTSADEEIAAVRTYLIENGYMELSSDEYAALDYDEKYKYKIAQIKKACESVIIAGTDADVLGAGELHYSLTEIKQRDISTLYAAVQAGAEYVLWHDDSRVMHEKYTAEQFTNLYNILYNFTVSCKIRSDGLEQYVINLYESEGDFDNITWDTELPDEIQDVVDEQIAIMTGATSDDSSDEADESGDGVSE